MTRVLGIKLQYSLARTSVLLSAAAIALSAGALPAQTETAQTQRNVCGSAFPGALRGARHVHGRWNQALEFDGRDDHVVVGSAGEPNLTHSMTVEAWVWADNDPERNARIASQGRTGQPGKFVLWQRDELSQQQAEFVIFDDQGTSYRARGPRLPHKVWTHIAGVHDADGRKLRLYINGGVVSEVEGPGSLNSTPQDPLILSASSDTSQAWRGRVDEFRLYDRALGPREVRRSYESGEYVPGRELLIRYTLDQPDFVEEDDLRFLTPRQSDQRLEPHQLVPFTVQFNGASRPAEMGYIWNGVRSPILGPGLRLMFNMDASTPEVEDLSGHGQTGVIEGATYSEGLFGQALDFDGSDQVTVSNGARDLEFSGDFTVEAWLSVKQDSSGTHAVISKPRVSTSGVVGAYALWRVGNLMKFSVSGESGVWHHATGAPLAKNGAWNHVVGVFDAANQRLRLHQNGRLTADEPGPARHKTSTAGVVIGNAEQDNLGLRQRRIRRGQAHRCAPVPVGSGEGSRSFHLGAFRSTPPGRPTRRSALSRARGGDQRQPSRRGARR